MLLSSIFFEKFLHVNSDLDIEKRVPNREDALCREDCGRVQYVNWAWREFCNLTYREKGALIVTVTALSGKNFISDIDILAHGFPSLSDSAVKRFVRGAEETGMLINDVYGWGYSIDDENSADNLTARKMVAESLLKYEFVKESENFQKNGFGLTIHNVCEKHPFLSSFNQLYPTSAGTKYVVSTLKYFGSEISTILTTVESVFVRSLARYGYFDQQTITHDYGLMRPNDISTHVSRVNRILKDLPAGEIFVGNLSEINIPGYLLNGSYVPRSEFMKDCILREPGFFCTELLIIQGCRVSIVTPKSEIYSQLPFTPKLSTSGDAIPNLIMSTPGGGEFACDATRLGILMLQQMAKYQTAVSFRKLSEGILGEGATGSQIQRLKIGYNRTMQLFHMAMGEPRQLILLPGYKTTRRETQRHYTEDPVIFPQMI